LLRKILQVDKMAKDGECNFGKWERVGAVEYGVKNYDCLYTCHDNELVFNSSTGTKLT
jgi:hypothetical protein